MWFLCITVVGYWRGRLFWDKWATVNLGDRWRGYERADEQLMTPWFAILSWLSTIVAHNVNVPLPTKALCLFPRPFLVLEPLLCPSHFPRVCLSQEQVEVYQRIPFFPAHQPEKHRITLRLPPISKINRSFLIFSYFNMLCHVPITLNGKKS